MLSENKENKMMEKNYWKTALGLFFVMVVGFPLLRIIVQGKPITWHILAFSVLFSAFIGLGIYLMNRYVPKRVLKSPKFLQVVFIVGAGAALLAVIHQLYDIFVLGKPMSLAKCWSYCVLVVYDCVFFVPSVKTEEESEISVLS